jgi:hypothetical protein
MVKRALIWTHFVSKSDGTRAQCTLCTGRNVEYATTHSATSQLWEHLRSAHHSEWEELQKQLQKKKNQKRERREGSTKQLTLMESNATSIAQTMDLKVVKYVVASYASFSSVDTLEFKDLFTLINYSPPDRRQLTVLLDKFALEVRSKLAHLIQDTTETIALTADGWTDDAGHQFIGVTGHFIDPEWQLHSRCLDVIQINESHTGEAIESMSFC